MKTNDRIRNVTFRKLSLASIITVFIVSVLYAGTSTAQGNRRGGEKGNGNWKERSNQPPGGERRNDVAMGRGNKGGDWKKNDAPDFNRNRNYEGGNMNKGRNDDWKNNRRNDNSGNINRPGNDDWKNNRRNDNPGNINRPGNDNINNRRRNDNPGNINRGGNDNRNMDRRGNDNIAGRGNDYRRNMYTRDRPGYRPVYQYDRRPVYNRYDPSWRYNYLPRRNSYFYNVPSTYFSISFGGFSYRYWDGVFYRPYNNLFTVCAPPVGIYINILPVGFRRIYVRNYPYYYYNGTYYDQRGSNYYVVSPPLGAIVESLPDGYETVVIDGETYYVVDGAQYKPVVVENGEIWYEVIKAN